MARRSYNRVGEVNKNKFGTNMIVIEDLGQNPKMVIVEFQDDFKYKIKTQYGAFKDGRVKNPYDKEVCNVGYVGHGKYNKTLHPHIYREWYHMLKRCYDPYYINKELTYKDCYVCDEWLNFQNFAKWYEENYYKCNDEKMELDKDILCKGNKIYSPQNCCFVPKRINALFTKRDKNRGIYPIGVYLHKDVRSKHKSLVVQLNILNNDGKKERKYLNSFSINKPFQAFVCYKNAKEDYIKQVADEYRSLIPNKLYEAMYKYEVEIND